MRGDLKMTTNTGKEATIKQNKDLNIAAERSAMDRSQRQDLLPKADIHETKQGAVLYIDLPGVNKDSLNIDVDNNVLTIKGGVELKTPDELNPTYIDVHAGGYKRKFTLSAELNSSKINANLSDGVLKLEIPRSEQHKPRKIEVKAA